MRVAIDRGGRQWRHRVREATTSRDAPRGPAFRHRSSSASSATERDETEHVAVEIHRPAFAVEGSAPTPPPPTGTTRLFVDSRGVEWEVCDESSPTAGWALDWDYLPQTSDPGLIFSSRLDRRRLWPCPPGWYRLGDAELEALCARGRSLL